MTYLQANFCFGIWEHWRKWSLDYKGSQKLPTLELVLPAMFWLLWQLHHMTSVFFCQRGSHILFSCRLTSVVIESCCCTFVLLVRISRGRFCFVDAWNRTAVFEPVAFIVLFACLIFCLLLDDSDIFMGKAVDPVGVFLKPVKFYLSVHREWEIFSRMC